MRTKKNVSVATTRIASNLSSQMYYVEVIDSNGCSITDSIFLGSNSQLIPNLSFDNVSCYGGSDGIAYSNPTGGTGPYSYNWSFTGSTNSSSSGLSANTTYSVQITDFNSCPTVTSFFTVPQPDSIFMSVIIDSVSCFMGTDGMITIDSINGAVGPYSYQWSNGQTNSFANNLVAGNYSVVVTDDLGCVDSSYSFSVYEPNQIVSNITITTNFNGSNITCFNDSTGELTASATGGTGSYSYLWSTGDTTSSIDSLNAGVYSVTVSDIYGCSDISYITLVNPDTIHFNYSFSDYNGNNISCNNDNDGTLDVNITGGSGINFSSIIWTDSNGNLLNNSNIINDTTLINLFAGTYSVTVSDFNGCSSSSSITLTEPASLQNFFTTDSITCNGDSDGSAYSNVSGGTAPYLYSWSNGSDSSSAHGLMANTSYVLSVQDINGCGPFLYSVQVQEPDAIYLGTILTLPSCNGINDGSLLVDSLSLIHI